MIESEVTPDQILALPLRDAVQLMATMIWFAKAGSNPGMTVDDALSVPFGEALQIMQAAEAAS